MKGKCATFYGILIISLLPSFITITTKIKVIKTASSFHSNLYNCFPCFIVLYSEEIMRARLTLPTTSASKKSINYAILQYHFYLLQRFYRAGAFELKINDVVVCQDFFCRVYCISLSRFTNLVQQICMDLKQATPHGNTVGQFERPDTLKNLAKLVNSLNASAEPNPNGSGFMGPSLTSKM